MSHEDVRAIADLARLAVPDERLDALATELSGILAHMDALTRVVSAGAVSGETEPGMRVAEDVGPPVALSRSIAEFAPRSRDGFFLVPRVASHADQGDA